MDNVSFIVSSKKYPLSYRNWYIRVWFFVCFVVVDNDDDDDNDDGDDDNDDDDDDDDDDVELFGTSSGVRVKVSELNSINCSENSSICSCW